MYVATETIGLAGEYAVAAELCRRGTYCQLTLGNRKKTDLLIDTNKKLFRVSVKAKQKQSWPRVKGIWQEGDLIVFVDYKGKELSMSPDFYVLDVAAWVKLVKKKKKKDPRAQIDKENTLYWPPSEGANDGWIGCQVSVAEIAEYKNSWPHLNAPEDLEEE